MRATYKQSPNMPCLGLKNRLKSYFARLTRTSVERIFDDKAVDLFRAYVKPSKAYHVEQELRYLDNLTDPEGRKFCRSMGRYSDMKEQLDLFKGPDRASNFGWNEHFKAAMEIVGRRYPKHLKMLEYHNDSDVHDALTDWSTSAGYDGIITGLRKKRDYLTNIYQNLLAAEEEAIANGRYTTPIMLATRTQGGGAYDDEGRKTYTCKLKKRAVMADSLYSVITACRVGNPLAYFLKYYHYTAIGKCDDDIKQQILLWRARCSSFVSLDYSKYDSTIPSWLLRYAFRILRACFDFRDKHEEELFDVIENSFIRKTLALPEGNIEVFHGTPSGNRLTSIINGIVNELMTETWSHAFGVRNEYMIMGDDNLIYLRWDGDPKELLVRVATYIEHNFGIIVNTDKSNYGTRFQDPEFLSRYWSASGPWRYDGDVIGLLAYPERFRDYKHTKLDPSMVVFAYILSYEKTMRGLMDVDRFLRDYSLSIAKLAALVEVRRELPWNVRNYLEGSNQVRRNIKKREARMSDGR